MARHLNLSATHMQPRAEQTRLPGGLQATNGHQNEGPQVCDMPMRRIPVIAAHLSIAAARRVMALRRISVLLVEDSEQVVGTVDQRALDAADDETPVATAMKPLGLHLGPRMSVAEAREMFVRARTNILPVIAGGFVLGAVERAVIERTRPEVDQRRRDRNQS